MVQFILRNNWKLISLLSFIILILSFSSTLLVINIIDYENMTERIESLNYQGITVDNNLNNTYSYYFDELFETSNFTVNDSKSINAFVLMQSQTFDSSLDVFNENIDLQSNNALGNSEIIVSKALMDNLNLKINDVISLNGLNTTEYTIVGSINIELSAYYLNEIIEVPVFIVGFDENRNWVNKLMFIDDVNLNQFEFTIQNSTLLEVIQRNLYTFTLAYIIICSLVLIGSYYVVLYGFGIHENMVHYKENGYQNRTKRLVYLLVLSVFVPWGLPLIITFIFNGISVFISIGLMLLLLPLSLYFWRVNH